MWTHGWASAHGYAFDYMCLTALKVCGGVESHVWILMRFMHYGCLLAGPNV